MGNLDNCSVPCDGRGEAQGFEIAVRPPIGAAPAEAVIARHKRRKKQVRRITIDLDPTANPTHGAQQLALFGRFYDTACYLPLAGFLTFDVEVEQYLLLRPRAGIVASRQGAIGALKRLLPRLRRGFPKA